MHSTDLPDLHLKIEYVPLASLKDNPLNPRLHPDRQIKVLARAISKFGFLVPILIDQGEMIVAGHARAAAARKLKLATVPVVRVEHLTSAELRALMLADNRLSDLSTFDDALLVENFRLLEIDTAKLDLELTGFTMGEIDVLLDPPVTNGKPDPDHEPIPPAQDPPVNLVGDVWQLGVHRLACGSALEPEVWNALMRGEKAVMSISDVPYNCKIAGHVSGLGKLRHEDFVMASGELSRSEFVAFLGTAFHELVRNSVDGSLHYTFIDWRGLGQMQDAGEGRFSELKNVIVWDKGAGSMGSLYRSAHEFIYLWKAGRGSHVNNVALGKFGRNRTNVWRYPGVRGFRHSDEGDLLALHSTPKPVRMIADAILDVTRRGDLVLDAFLGSGTSIIAAERVGRRCYGCELDPKYADTIIARFERHSGEPAIHLATGLTFAQVAAERRSVSTGEAAHG